MSFALPESLREYIDRRVRSGDYGNTSEYLRDLIRRDQQAEAARRFRLLISDGIESGDSRVLGEEVIEELRRRALGLGAEPIGEEGPERPVPKAHERAKP